MTKTIGDKAEASDSADVFLAKQSTGLYRLASLEVVDADEIGTDEFPKYGDFIECQTSNGGADPSWDETVYVELPGDLAKKLTENGVEPDDAFRILSQQKDHSSGEWSFEIDADPDVPM